MHTKTLNLIIFAVSQVINLLIILYFAVLAAKLVWWLINPALDSVYIEKSSATEFEKSFKYVNNRHPFGIISKVVESAPPEPEISSLVKLNGIYFNPPKSLAFITYSDKSYVASIGDKIMNNAILTSISTDLIVVSQNGADATIRIDPNKNGSDSKSSFATDTSSSNFTSYNNDSSNNDIKERRKKLIEDFTQKAPNNPSSNNLNPNANGSDNINTNLNQNNKLNNQESNRAFSDLSNVTDNA